MKKYIKKLKSNCVDYFILFKYYYLNKHKFTIKEGLRLCDLNKMLYVIIDNKYYNVIYKKDDIYQYSFIKNSTYVVDLAMLKCCSNVYFTKF